MAALSTAIALVMIAQGVTGLQWSPASLQNNSMVYECATGTLSLPWSVTVAPGDTIVDISWFVSGKSQEMIATAAHGNFFAMPAFANRVRHLANAGIELDNMGVSETGTYSVEVVGRSAAGKLTTLKGSVTVRVADGLQTTDGHLHISQQQEAEYDKSTDQFYVVLRCGTFPYPTHPAFEVTWETPSGQNRQSSGYDNGTFHLKLDAPVQGGVYTCLLPPVLSCAHGNGSAVSTRVDKTEVRLLLVEARQAALDSKNTDLVRQNNELQAALLGLGEEDQLLKVQLGSLKNDTSALQNSTSALENRVHAQGEENQLLKLQQSSLQNSTSALENRVHAQGEENQLLKIQQSYLQNSTSALENRVHAQGEENQLLNLQLGSLKNDTSALQNRVHAQGSRLNATEGLLTQTVSFQARLPWSSVDVVAGPLVLPDVLRNHGDGYDNTTGVFTAPHSGTYCFLATAANADAAADSQVYLYLSVNGVDVAYMLTKRGLSLQPASLHAVAALKAGETAYLYHYDHVHYYGPVTSFSGFLVDHTPN